MPSRNGKISMESLPDHLRDAIMAFKTEDITESQEEIRDRLSRFQNFEAIPQKDFGEMISVLITPETSKEVLTSSGQRKVENLTSAIRRMFNALSTVEVEIAHLSERLNVALES